MDKVEETFLSENNVDRFMEFRNILQEFDPEKESVPDLYYVSITLMFPHFEHC